MKNFMPDVFELIKMLFWAGVEVKRERGGEELAVYMMGMAGGLKELHIANPSKYTRLKFYTPRKPDIKFSYSKIYKT